MDEKEILQEIDDIDDFIEYHEASIISTKVRYENGDLLYDFFRRCTINSYESILYNFSTSLKNLPNPFI